MQGMKMKRLFRRNQIIITTLAIMIAAAGYLNYAGKKELAASGTLEEAAESIQDISDEDILAENEAVKKLNNRLASNGVTDDDSSSEIASWDEEENAEYVLDETEQEAGMENPGEAILTSGMSVSDYIANVKLSREQIRAKNKDTLMNLINNENLASEEKEAAVQDMIEMTAVSEKENAAETLLKAKGFSDPVVSVTSGKVDVVINASEISDQQRAQIEDIVKRKTETTVENIVITLLDLEN